MDRLPLFLDLKNRRVGVIGRGSLAARRVEALFSAGADVRLFASDASAEFAVLAGRFHFGDLADPQAFEDCALCYFAPEEGEDPDAALIARARAAGALVNVADHPQISDFIVPSCSTAARWSSRFPPAATRPCLAACSRPGWKR